MKRHATTLLLTLLLAIHAAAATWDDYGAKPNDKNFDNGPILSKIIADQCSRKIVVPPKGTLADYYIQTSIQWPSSTGGALEGGGGYTYAYSIPTIGATRLVWSGEKGGKILVYRGSGGRIGRMILCGGPLSNDYKSVAGTGIEVEAISEPPSGNLVTDQLSITQCDVGLHYLATPHNDHADLQKHYALLTHRVRVPYWVAGYQSCPHWIYGFDCREGYETAFKFDKGSQPTGGALHVFGMYLGYSKGATVLYVGRSNDYTGDFEINGLQVDGSVKDLTLVNHGWFAGRVRFNGGNIGFARDLHTPMVVDRDGIGKYNDIKIDMRNAQWPEKGGGL